MPSTPIYALPYPAAADPADVPLDMQELAERIELLYSELAYVQFTAAVTISSTAEATPTDIVSAGSITFDGKPIWAEFFAPYLQPGAAVGATIFINLYQDGTALGRMTLAVAEQGTTLQPQPVGAVRRRLTPSAGSHTIKVGGVQATAAGVVGAGAGGPGNYMPGYLRLTRA